jgi:hypothetical protein
MTYVIVPTSDLSSVDFGLVEESEPTLRYSLDGSKFLLKYKGSQPSFLSGSTEYTKEETLSIVTGSEWTPSSP